MFFWFWKGFEAVRKGSGAEGATTVITNPQNDAAESYRDERRKDASTVIKNLLLNL